MTVSEREGEPALTIPLEDDGTLLSSRLEDHFNQSTGLRFRRTENKLIQGLRCVDGKFYPPKGGWEDCVYFCGGITKYSKRKADDTASEDEVTPAKVTRNDLKPTDLILLGLDKDTTEEQIRQCFGKFGELHLVSIKRDKDGVSKGFGFIRFATYESQETVLENDSHFYLVNGRWCEVKIPLSKLKDQNLGAKTSPENKYLESKIFVGRCVPEITQSDLRDHFSKFGNVTHVYVPTNRSKPFAFVTFKDSAVAKRLWGEDHTIKGNSVSIRPAAEKPSYQSQSSSPNPSNGRRANLPVIQNARLTDEVMTEIREILGQQNTGHGQCQTHRPCFHANATPRKLTLTSLVQIIQNQEQLLPFLIQRAANLAQEVNSSVAFGRALQTAGSNQAQGGPVAYQAQQGPMTSDQQLLDCTQGYFTSAGAEISRNYPNAMMQRGPGGFRKYE